MRLELLGSAARAAAAATAPAGHDLGIAVLFSTCCCMGRMRSGNCSRTPSAHLDIVTNTSGGM